MTKWEYQTLKIDLPESWFSMGGRIDAAEIQEPLSHYGAQGWELAVGIDLNKHQGATTSVILILKRPKSEG